MRLIKPRDLAIVFFGGAFVFSIMVSPMGAVKSVYADSPGQSASGQAAGGGRWKASSEIMNKFRTQAKQWNNQIAALKGLSDKYQSSLTEAQKKTGFNVDAMKADVALIPKIKDSEKRQRLIEQLHAKYNSQLSNVMESAKVDPNAVRQEISVVIKRPVSPARTLEASFSGGDRVAQPAANSQPVVTEQTLRPPYNKDGLVGIFDLITGTVRGNNVDPTHGVLTIVNDESARSVQRVAFIGQDFQVRPGMGRVHANVQFDPISYEMYDIIFAGYGNTEAIAKLYVMDGANEMCSQRFSLYRISTIAAGLIGQHDSRSLELSCDFTRANTSEAGVYTVFASIESWAGAAGVYADASVTMDATISYFQINQFIH